MTRHAVFLALALALALPLPVFAQADEALTKQVDAAIDKGVEWLKGRQLKTGDFKGTWGDGVNGVYGGGNATASGGMYLATTVLSMMTLLRCGVDPDDACIKDVAITGVPAGDIATLEVFNPSGSMELKGAVILYWDYGGADTIVWSSYAANPVDGTNLAVNEFAGDGAKKLAIVVSNQSEQTAYLSATALFTVTTP